MHFRIPFSGNAPIIAAYVLPDSEFRYPLEDLFEHAEMISVHAWTHQDPRMDIKSFPAFDASALLMVEGSRAEFRHEHMLISRGSIEALQAMVEACRMSEVFRTMIVPKEPTNFYAIGSYEFCNTAIDMLACADQDSEPKWSSAFKEHFANAMWGSVAWMTSRSSLTNSRRFGKTTLIPACDVPAQEAFN